MDERAFYCLSSIQCMKEKKSFCILADFRHNQTFARDQKTIVLTQCVKTSLFVQLKFARNLRNLNFGIKIQIDYIKSVFIILTFGSKNGLLTHCALLILPWEVGPSIGFLIYYLPFYHFFSNCLLS